MNWNKLTQVGQIEEIKELSMTQPVLIFKHSTRCSVSSMSLDRLLRNWKPEDTEKIVPYFLDLIAYRELSDRVEDEFGVPHQSPQIILIKNGVAVYDNSHFGISYPEIMGQI
ncbi:bacillithiol system redox-active protein YtxJ [Algoriphagus sp. CAU 1675]|uniref:bacillithiol system redox-active protein YtxJ n=1 Tax=Algoriphagus sp. CAU 1675 TaxID=3032597 RepID=UPI0023DA3060|nr:bacillithiol system redox-active protein YtxJ [Algoriphagus sp. CAU 1675]MDF2156293.1 bacillithiol system redox-active protein YtxJ [Algoriphagus sp. CAU 1675]